MLFGANKLFQKVMINPRIASTADYRAAITAYNNVLTNFDHHTANASIQKVLKQSYLTVAQLWILQGEYDKATQIYDAFLQDFPEDKNYGLFVHFANAKSNERIFNLNKTLSEYETIIRQFGDIQDPLKPNINVLNLPLAVARLNASKDAGNSKADQYKTAENYYLVQIRRHPKSETAFYSTTFLASIYADQQRWYNVIDLFDKLIKDYPGKKELANIKLSLGNVYLDGMNQPAKAIQIFDSLLKKHKDDDLSGYVYLAKARAIIKIKQYDKARNLLKWILETYPANQSLCASSQLTLASTYELQGHWSRAVGEYRWVKEKYPATPQGLYIPLYIADYYQKHGEKQLVEDSLNEAIKQYRTLVKKYPKTVLAGMAQEYIIYCLSAQKNWASAAEAANSLKRIYPGTRSEISSYLFLGQIYENSHQTKEARQIYNRFLKKFPHHPLASQVQNKLKLLN